MDYSLWGALATSFVICAASGPVLIPLLHKLKFGQSIRDCGPQAHQKKSGTPTMGGLMILTAVLVAVLVWCKLTPAVLIALLLTFGHALIGFVDDYIKVVMKRNLGLTVSFNRCTSFKFLSRSNIFYLYFLLPSCTILKYPEKNN